MLFLFIALFVQNTCMVVYTKEKLAKCRAPVLDLLIKVGFSLHLVHFSYSTVDKCVRMKISCLDKLLRHCSCQKLHRFSKQQKLPVWSQTFESVKYSTDITANSVRRAN